MAKSLDKAQRLTKMVWSILVSGSKESVWATANANTVRETTKTFSTKEIGIITCAMVRENWVLKTATLSKAHLLIISHMVNAQSITKMAVALPET